MPLKFTPCQTKTSLLTPETLGGTIDHRLDSQWLKWQSTPESNDNNRANH